MLTIEGTGKDDSYGALIDNIKLVGERSIDQSDKEHQDNGHGNGDNEAPGSSKEHNNAENAVTPKTLIGDDSGDDKHDKSSRNKDKSDDDKHDKSGRNKDKSDDDKHDKSGRNKDKSDDDKHDKSGRNKDKSDDDKYGKSGDEKSDGKESDFGSFLSDDGHSSLFGGAFENLGFEKGASGCNPLDISEVISDDFDSHSLDQYLSIGGDDALEGQDDLPSDDNKADDRSHVQLDNNDDQNCIVSDNHFDFDGF
ncbi:MAG: hypothetical protein U9R28_09260 [Pseudomonadota bacterium]|nr:hypothetical protein [Pseudomonadota bacterium]